MERRKFTREFKLEAVRLPTTSPQIQCHYLNRYASRGHGASAFALAGFGGRGRAFARPTRWIKFVHAA